MRRRGALIAVVAATFGFGESAHAEPQTLLASRASGSLGAPLQPARSVSVSADGRRVAFLVGHLTHRQAYARDLHTGATVLASRADGTDGAPANGQGAEAAVLSADGRKVAFVSAATNLPGGGSRQVYVRDLDAGTTVLASRQDGPLGPAAGAESLAGISADGSRVAFVSHNTYLTAGIPGAGYGVFVRDLAAGRTILASRDDGAVGAPASGLSGAISGDGDAVAFTSEQDLSGSGGEPGGLYVRRLSSHTTELVQDGRIEYSGADSRDIRSPDVSSDGRRIAFALRSDGEWRAYARALPDGERVLVSRSDGPDGEPASAVQVALAADGRQAAFASGSVSGQPFGTHVFRRDLDDASTVLVSRASGTDGAPTNAPAYQPDIDADGGTVAFESDATNLVGDAVLQRSRAWVRGSGLPVPAYPADWAPVLEASGTVGSVPVGTAVGMTLEAADWEGPIATWRVSWGDGTPDDVGTGAPPRDLSHTYETVGVFTATASVTDSAGQRASAEVRYATQRLAVSLRADRLTERPASVGATLRAADDGYSGGEPLADRTLTFRSLDGAALCEATTDQAGRAECTNAGAWARAVASRGYTVRFAGDDTYASATARSTLP